MNNSVSTYDQHALEFIENRDRSSIGTETVRRWSESLPKGSTVIELACGSGYPITRALVESESELNLWAIDSSPVLVEKFKSRFPQIPVHCEKVQTSAFFNQTYDAVLAVGLIFLLSEEDQLTLIPRVSDVLNLGGKFLFTAPLEIGDWKDSNTGITCQSLGRKRYEEILIQSGFEILSTFDDSGQNNYYDTVLRGKKEKSDN